LIWLPEGDERNCHIVHHVSAGKVFSGRDLKWPSAFRFIAVASGFYRVFWSLICTNILPSPTRRFCHTRRSFRLFICWFAVSMIIQKVTGGFGWNF